MYLLFYDLGMRTVPLIGPLNQLTFDVAEGYRTGGLGKWILQYLLFNGCLENWLALSSTILKKMFFLIVYKLSRVINLPYVCIAMDKITFQIASRCCPM